jgi:hypothetical protein
MKSVTKHGNVPSVMPSSRGIDYKNNGMTTTARRNKMEKRIVEINGVKMEIDLTEAKVVENYRVGDKVKVLVKTYSNYESKPGIIVGFDAFEKLPTIIIAYLETSYSTASIKFVYFNSESKDTELCPANGKEMVFEKGRVIELMDNEIQKKKTEVEDMERRKEFFLAEFGSYFKTEVSNA